MKKIERLRLEALEACEFRGHRMGLFDRLSKHFWNSKCLDCGMEVCIMDNPAPNEIEIAGKAVALHCRDEDS